MYCIVVPTCAQMYMVITTAYLIFWAPLFLVTLLNYTSDWKAAKNSVAHEVRQLNNSFLGTRGAVLHHSAETVLCFGIPIVLLSCLVWLLSCQSISSG